MVGGKSVWLTEAVGELVMSTKVDTPLRATFLSTPVEDFSEEEEEEDVGAVACVMVGGGGAVLRACCEAFAACKLRFLCLLLDFLFWNQ